MIDSKSQLYSLKSNNLFSSIKDFDVVDSIGTGAFSSVFLAIHKHTHKKYALKEFNINRMNKNAIINIVKEIQIHRTVKHPDIVEFIDHFTSKNFFYIVLEYVNGDNLYSFMRQQSNLQEDDVKLIFSKILGGMKYLHSNGIVMRDLKPENVIISKDKKVIKLCDFGWASFIQDKQWLMKMAGTYSYMAPESLQSQMQGFETDVWALGIFLYELIHGKEPYPGTNPTSVLNQIKTMNISYDRSINSQAKDLINKLLKYEKFQRPQVQDIINHIYIKDFYNSLQVDNNEQLDKFFYEKKILNDSDLFSTNHDEKQQKNTEKKKYNQNANMIRGPRKNQSQVCIQRVNQSTEKNYQEKQNIKVIMRDHSTNLLKKQSTYTAERFQPQAYYINKSNNNIDLYSTQNLFTTTTQEKNIISNNTSQRTISIDRSFKQPLKKKMNSNKGIQQEKLFQQSQTRKQKYNNNQYNKNSYKFYNNLSTEESFKKLQLQSKEQLVQPKRRLTKQFYEQVNLKQISSKSIPIKINQKKNPLQQRITLKKQKTLMPKILFDEQIVSYSTKYISSIKNNNQKQNKEQNFLQNLISFNTNKKQNLVNPLQSMNSFTKKNTYKDFQGYSKKSIKQKQKPKKSLLAQALPLDTQKQSKYYKQRSKKSCVGLSDISSSISSRWINYQSKNQKSQRMLKKQFNFKQIIQIFSQLQ